MVLLPVLGLDGAVQLRVEVSSMKLSHLCPHGQMLCVSAKCSAMAHRRPSTKIPQQALLSARLHWVPGCNCWLNAPLQSSCNHKIYNLMEIRAGVQRPCGLAVYHNDLCRSINAVNRKPIPSSLTYLSFEKGQMLRLDVNNALMMGMIKVPSCKGGV